MLRAVWKLLWVEAKLYLREPPAFFFTLLFPTLLVLVFGAVFGNKPGMFSPRFGYIDAEVPAIAAIIIGTVALMGIPVATATKREQGILRRYRATPLSPAAYLAADLGVNLGMALLGMLILVVTAKLLFGLRFGGSWPSVLTAFILAALAFFSMGYLVASLAPSARVAQTVGSVAYFPMMFLSGAALPRQIMPDNVRHVSDALPLTIVVKLLQGLWQGGAWGDHWGEVGILAGMLVAGTLVSSRAFRWE